MSSSDFSNIFFSAWRRDISEQERRSGKFLEKYIDWEDFSMNEFLFPCLL